MGLQKYYDRNVAGIYVNSGGGTGTLGYFWGETSRYTFSFGSFHESNTAPQMAQRASPGFPFAEKDSATS